MSEKERARYANHKGADALDREIVAEMASDIDRLRAELAEAQLMIERQRGWVSRAATAKAAIARVRDLCADPGGPDSWSFTYDGRHGLFAEDVLRALDGAE